MSARVMRIHSDLREPLPCPLPRPYGLVVIPYGRAHSGEVTWGRSSPCRPRVHWLSPARRHSLQDQHYPMASWLNYDMAMATSTLR